MPKPYTNRRTHPMGERPVLSKAFFSCLLCISWTLHRRFKADSTLRYDPDLRSFLALSGLSHCRAFGPPVHPHFGPQLNDAPRKPLCFATPRDSPPAGWLRKAAAGCRTPKPHGARTRLPWGGVLSYLGVRRAWGGLHGVYAADRSRAWVISRLPTGRT